MRDTKERMEKREREGHVVAKEKKHHGGHTYDHLTTERIQVSFLDNLRFRLMTNSFLTRCNFLAS